MNGIGVIIVSHSAKLGEGLVDLVQEMNDGSVRILSASGAGDGRLGTNTMNIKKAIESLDACANILLYCDMGSSVISAETAISLLEEDLSNRTQIVNCPIVEGAFVGVVHATITDDVDAVIRESKSARDMQKC